MRRRVTDNADMRLYLSRFLQAVDETGWPRHSGKLLLYISAQPGGRVAYSKASVECELNEGQMERAVTALALRTAKALYLIASFFGAIGFDQIPSKFRDVLLALRAVV